MSHFDEYRDRYENFALEREDGILEFRLHSGDGPLRWCESAHREFGPALADVGRDTENRVVILTGTGDTFLTELDFETRASTPAQWDKVYREGLDLVKSLLDIPVPVIGVINGPVSEHAEIALLSDIVLAADDAYIQDAEHFPAGVVPGDGVHVVWPLLLGLNRGRYFLLTGQRLSAHEAHAAGVVNEVLPRPALMPRARDIARALAAQTDLTLRYTRTCLTMMVKDVLSRYLPYGLALESIAAVDRRSGSPTTDAPGSAVAL